MKPQNKGAKFALKLAVMAVALGAFYFGFFGTAHTNAAAGTNPQLNYQGRLLDNTGAVVADGLYNMEFKVYQDGNGCVGGGFSPCGGTLKWTETRIQTNRVTVTNGYFSVNLGAITAFAASVDWNQDTLWLSINIGGTTNTPTPTWDGEMTPFKRLTSTPYAFNSNQLQGLQASSFVQIAQGVQTDTSTANASIFVNKNNSSGTPNILELQKSSSDVFVVGNGGSLVVTPSDTAATISLGTTAETGTITIGQYNGASTSAINIGANAGASSTQQVNIGNSATGINTVSIGSGNSSSATTISGGTGGINLTPNGSSNSGVSVKPTNNTTAGFQIQSASAADTLLTADTTNNKIVIGNATGTNSATTQLIVDAATADPVTGYNGSIYYNSTNDKFRCYQSGAWADCLGATQNSTLSVVSGLANIAANQTGTPVETLVFTSATAVSNIAGATGFTAAAGGSFRSCLIKNNANVTAGTLALRWRVNGVSVGSAACNMNSTVNRSSSSALDAGVVTFSTGDTIGIAFDTSAAYAPITDDYTVFWTIEYNSTLTNAGATLQSAYDNNATLTTTDTHDLLINAADTATDANLLFNLQCVTSCSTNGRFAVQNAGTDVLTVSPNSGNITLAPAGTGSVVVNADSDSNLQVNYTSTNDATLDIAHINIVDNAAANTGLLYGLAIVNNDNGANVGVPDALAYLKNANAAETVPDGLLVEQTGAGTLTNGLEVKQTAGAITNGLQFTGTFGAVLKVGATTVINASGQVPTSQLTGNFSFANISAATNTNALLIGTGGSLGISGSGTIGATSLSANYVASVANGTGITGGAAGSNAAALTLGIDQTAALTWTGTETFTGDNTHNVAINNTFTGTGPTQTGLAVTLTDNATAAGTSYGLSVTNADNGANVGVPAALAYLKNANASDTVVDGLLVEQTGAGTLTNGLEIKRTAGTVTNGLTFTGAIGSEIKLQNAETISNGTNGTIALAADSGAVTLSLSGTAATVSNTAGALGITAAAGLTLASSANNNIVLSPNGSGDITVSQAAGSQILISASAVPTADMLNITNASQGVTAAGVNGLSINYVGGAAAVESAGQRIDLTGGTTAGAGAIWSGLRIVQGTITTGTTVQDVKFETAALTTTSGTTVINGLNLASAGAINNSTAGSIAWNGLNIVNPNITQGAGGSTTAIGLNITLGTVTTGGLSEGLKIVGSGTTPTAGTFERLIDAQDSSGNSLFELRDLSNANNNFGAAATTGAFIGHNSYWGEEFNVGHNLPCNTTAALSAGTTNAYARGDYGGNANSTVVCASGATTTVNAGELNVTDVIGTATIAQNQCLVSTPSATSANGLERITAQITAFSAGGKAACAETLAFNTTTSNKILTTTNLPVITMKLKVSAMTVNATGSVITVGANIANNPGTDGAGVNLPNTGVFFTNCSTYTAGVPSGCSNTNWYGMASTANALVGGGTAGQSCTVGAGNITTAFSYLRIEVRGGSDIHFFADYDTSNGIVESECGTGLSAASNASAMAPWIEVKAVSSTANLTNSLDVDYMRIWQDDNVPIPVANTPLPNTETSTPPLSTNSLLDSAAIVNGFLDISAATGDDTVFNHDVYVAGTLYADKIKANQIEGIEILTDKLSSLSAQLAKDKATVAAGPTPPPDLSHLSNVQAVSLVTLANIESKGGLTVGKDAQFNGKTLFALLAEFNGPAKFNGAVSFNSDAGGQAVIKKGASKVEIKFGKAYLATPIIGANYLFNATDPVDDQAKLQRLQDGGYGFIVSQTTAKGFIIILNKPATEDINFTWLATQINNPVVSQSKPVETVSP